MRRCSTIFPNPSAAIRCRQTETAPRPHPAAHARFSAVLGLPALNLDAPLMLGLRFRLMPNLSYFYPSINFFRSSSLGKTYLTPYESKAFAKFFAELLGEFCKNICAIFCQMFAFLLLLYNLLTHFEIGSH